MDFYKVIVDRYSEFDIDGILSSDDLGHQNGPMMSPEIFKELYFPLYNEIISYIHSKNMHFLSKAPGYFYNISAAHKMTSNTHNMPYESLGVSV